MSHLKVRIAIKQLLWLPTCIATLTIGLPSNAKSTSSLPRCSSHLFLLNAGPQVNNRQRQLSCHLLASVSVLLCVGVGAIKRQLLSFLRTDALQTSHERQYGGT